MNERRIPEPEARSRAEAQRRADRIAAFRDELRELIEQGLVEFAPADLERIRRHHDERLAALAEGYDVDLGEGAKRLSLGMRLASLFGALALAASAYLLFYRFWGLLSTPVQVAILIAAPLAGLAATAGVARRESTGTLATLTALVALACFVLDLSVLGDVFNLVPSPQALLAWGGLGMILAYAYRLRLLLFTGLGFLVCWAAATIVALGGASWTAVGDRPETLLVPALLACALPSIVPHRRCAEFAPIYRIAGLLALFIALLWLGNSGQDSVLPFDPDAVEGTYQVLGFLAAAGAVWLGIRRGWSEAVNLGSTFFVVFLGMKFVDWWWEWMPKYLFFLIVGAAAVLALLALKRLRGAMARAAAGGAR